MYNERIYLSLSGNRLRGNRTGRSYVGGVRWQNVDWTVRLLFGLDIFACLPRFTDLLHRILRYRFYKFKKKKTMSKKIGFQNLQSFLKTSTNTFLTFCNRTSSRFLKAYGKKLVNLRFCCACIVAACGLC